METGAHIEHLLLLLLLLLLPLIIRPSDLFPIRINPGTMDLMRHMVS
jgi:hypothetical protein